MRSLVLATILRCIFSMGPEPTLWLLGFITVNRAANLSFIIDIILHSVLTLIVVFSGNFQTYPSH